MDKPEPPFVPFDRRRSPHHGPYLPAMQRGRERCTRGWLGGRSRDRRLPGRQGGGRYGSRRIGAGAIHYEIVNVIGRGSPMDPDAYTDVQLAGTAGSLAPGCYATMLVDLPVSQATDGFILARGFYAVLWPMNDDSTGEDERPRYVGPFASPGRAREFIRNVAAPW